ATEEFSAQAIFLWMAFHQSDREAAQPTEIVGQCTLAGSAVVLAESDVQGPVHRLDGPVTANRFAVALAAEVATGDVIAYLARLATIGVLGHAQCVADRLDPGPFFGAREIARRLGEEVSPFVDATVRVVGRLVLAITQVFEVAFDLVVEERFDGDFKSRLVVFDGNDEVTAAIADLFADIFL